VGLEVDMNKISFWKPVPLPPVQRFDFIAFDLLPLGSLKEVSECLLDIPHMFSLPSMPWEEARDRFFWDVDTGVFLSAAPESGFKPGMVITLPAQVHIGPRQLYRLYLHVFEHFGTIMLDEERHEFLTPMQYKKFRM
jgi:hypothetical protein